MKQLTVYIDGASQGNPGPSGIGVLIYGQGNQLIKKIQKHIGPATNNIAEYKALIAGLTEALLLHASQITVYTDSELIANQMNGKYKVKNANLQVCYQEATHLLSGFKKVIIEHIPRSKNTSADVLAFNASQLKQ